MGGGGGGGGGVRCMVMSEVIGNNTDILPKVLAISPLYDRSTLLLRINPWQ